MIAEELALTSKAPPATSAPSASKLAPASDKSDPRAAFVILDKALEGRTNLVAGANKADYHSATSRPAATSSLTRIADVRNINEGELDPIGGKPLRLGKAVEIGHIFKLGYKYSKSMGASVLNRDGKEVTPIMGCYGIGIERILTAAIEVLRRRQRRHRPTRSPGHRALSGRRHHHQHRRRSSPRSRRKSRRRPRQPRVSTSFSTTATSAPESNSKTPTSSASPIESILDAE